MIKEKEVSLMKADLFNSAEDIKGSWKIKKL